MSGVLIALNHLAPGSFLFYRVLTLNRQYPLPIDVETDFVDPQTMQNKNIFEGFLAALIMVLAVFAIREFFRNDRNQLVSARGRQVLNDVKLMEQVKKEMEKHDLQGISGPVVVHLH